MTQSSNNHLWRQSWLANVGANAIRLRIQVVVWVSKKREGKIQSRVGHEAECRVAARFHAYLLHCTQYRAQAVGYKTPANSNHAALVLCYAALPLCILTLLASSLFDQHRRGQRPLRRRDSCETVLQYSPLSSRRFTLCFVSEIPVAVQHCSAWTTALRWTLHEQGVSPHRATKANHNAFCVSPCASAFLSPSASPRATFPRTQCR